MKFLMFSDFVPKVENQASDDKILYLCYTRYEAFCSAGFAYSTTYWYECYEQFRTNTKLEHHQNLHKWVVGCTETHWNHE